jgi:hypothetical protein
MDTLIDYSRTRFIKGRNIYDNIICAEKILFKVRKRKTKGFFLN